MIFALHARTKNEKNENSPKSHKTFRKWYIVDVPKPGNNMDCKILFVDSSDSEQMNTILPLSKELLPASAEAEVLVIPEEETFSETVKRVKDSAYDLVISFDAELDEKLSILPDFPAVLFWDERPGREAIRRHLEHIVHDGYLSAIVEQKRNLFSVLESLDEAVIAHDMNRRIIYFSKRAEEMTGIPKNDAIGADCHELFPFVLCGGECSLCSGNEKNITQKRYSSVMYDKDQQRKEMEVVVSPLRHLNDEIYGALIILKNVSHERELERRLGDEEQFHRLVGNDRVMQNLYEMIRNVGVYDFPVLIHGESGTGKELIADAVHKESRRKGLFVPVNCGAIPEGTLESELFGHVKGSFTGAVRDKKGRFELADGGTIFLDEIGELPLSMQVKLLRVLQESVIEPVGGEKSKKIDVRVISATNKDLRKMVDEGTFREDLYYRLAVVPVEVPPLRERNNDVLLLANSFLKQIGEKFDRQGLTLSRRTESLFLSYSWPGNVRQLLNASQYAMIKSFDGIIEPEHLPPEISGISYQDIARQTPPEPMLLAKPASEPEESDEIRLGRKPVLNRESIIQALLKTGGNKAKAARVLNVGRATLYNYLKKYPEIAEEVPEA